MDRTLAEKIVLYGIGGAGKTALGNLKNTKSIVAICTSERQPDEKYQEIPLIIPTELSQYQYDKIVVATSFVTQVVHTLRTFDIPEEKIEIYTVVDILTDERLDQFDAFISSHPALEGKRNAFLKGDAETINALLSQSANVFSYKEWCELNNHLVSIGNFAAALLCRERAKERLFQNEDQNDCQTVIDRFLARLDDGDSDNARRALKPMAHCCAEKRPEELWKHTCLYYLSIGDLETAAETVRSNTELSIELKKRVEGKRVAVVGPCVSDLCDGKEIDEFEVVVRLTPLPLAPDRHKYRGSRTDIAFVVANFPEYHTDEILRHFWRDDIFFVYESLMVEKQHEMIRNGNAAATLPSCSLFNGQSTFLQRILQYLFPYRPTEIKLFKFDFFASLQNYNADYKSMFNVNNTLSPESHRILTSMAIHHDFGSNFLFTQRLLKNQSIRVDNRLHDILNLTISEYYSNLEHVFSKKI